MVKFEGKIGTLYQIFTIDLRVILSIIVATGVYALLLKFLQKNSPHNVQTKGGGGGGKAFLKMLKKTALFSHDGFPNSHIHPIWHFGKRTIVSNCVFRKISKRIWPEIM